MLVIILQDLGVGGGGVKLENLFNKSARCVMMYDLGFLTPPPPPQKKKKKKQQISIPPPPPQPVIELVVVDTKVNHSVLVHSALDYVCTYR